MGLGSGPSFELGHLPHRVLKRLDSRCGKLRIPPTVDEESPAQLAVLDDPVNELGLVLLVLSKRDTVAPQPYGQRSRSRLGTLQSLLRMCDNR